jgi:hypothetical protein
VKSLGIRFHPFYNAGMTDIPFLTTQHFQQHFIQRLTQLLDNDELGVFILVLANATMDSEIFARLKPLLAKKYQYFINQIEQFTDYPVDDLSVFKQLLELGLDNIQLTRQRTSGPWVLQYNQLRSFRPARNSQNTISNLFQPFDARAFHFNKPFLAKEIIWKGQIQSSPVTLFYNKFPFADYHALMLIDAEKEKPQFLSLQDCSDIWLVIEALTHIQGMAFAYNSLGALASVNHQHWQMLLSQQPYPVEHSRWTHNGGADSYPLPVDCFESTQNAWNEIDKLQHCNQAFNLFIRPQKVYLIKRKTQGEYPQPLWSGGLAWSELSGQFTLTQFSDYEELSTQKIEQLLAQLRV